MADKRINALANTAPSTASDDFIAVDGTTNGTRKLNAFSPTFGGNATVTGTLTANGLLSAAGSSTLDGLPTSAVFGGTKRVVAGYSTLSDYGFLASVDNGVGWKDLWLNPSGGSIKAGGQLIQVADPATIALWKDSTPTKAARFQFNTLADNGFSLGVYDGSSWFNAITVAPTTGVVKVPNTSASTTTSTGALVVGNGTSGGLGVGGSVNIGGTLTTGNFTKVSNLSVANGSEYGAFRSEIGNDGTLGALLVDVGGLPSATGSSRYGFISAGDNGAWRKFYVGGRPSGGAQVLIPSTDISTTTSSGALVVSGGVGVGEQIHAKYYTATSNIVAGFTANTHVLDYYSGTARNVVFGPDASTIGNWKLQLLRSDASASIDALTISNAGNGVFYGSVKTAAPSGGTAAAWKLGTVATVSPTSPNRTIEVDIGGTIYYLAAKTTNN